MNIDYSFEDDSVAGKNDVIGSYINMHLQRYIDPDDLLDITIIGIDRCHSVGAGMQSSEYWRGLKINSIDGILDRKDSTSLNHCDTSLIMPKAIGLRYFKANRKFFRFGNGD